MAFAEGRDAKQMAERVVGHDAAVLWLVRVVARAIYGVKPARRTIPCAVNVQRAVKAFAYAREKHRDFRICGRKSPLPMTAN